VPIELRILLVSPEPVLPGTYGPLPSCGGAVFIGDILDTDWNAPWNERHVSQHFAGSDCGGP